MIMKYKAKGTNRIETDEAIIGITKAGGIYTVCVIKKDTNALSMKQYRKREAINSFTKKYGVQVEF